MFDGHSRWIQNAVGGNTVEMCISWELTWLQANTEAVSASHATVFVS